MDLDWSLSIAGAFGTLPREVRFMIWRYYLGFIWQCLCLAETNNVHPDYRLSIMRTCKLIHHEVDHLLHDRLSFILTIEYAEVVIRSNYGHDIATLSSEHILNNTSLFEFASVLQRLPLLRACTIDLDLDLQSDTYEEFLEAYTQLSNLSRLLCRFISDFKAIKVTLSLSNHGYLVHRPDLEMKFLHTISLTPVEETIFELPAVVAPILEFLEKLADGVGTMVINDSSEQLIVTRMFTYPELEPVKFVAAETLMYFQGPLYLRGKSVTPFIRCYG